MQCMFFLSHRQIVKSDLQVHLQANNPLQHFSCTQLLARQKKTNLLFKLDLALFFTGDVLIIK